MPDRIARPPVRLRGGLPDGNLAGIPDAVARRFLGDEPPPVYALIKLTRRQLIHDDETDGDVAELRVAAIEVLPDEATFNGPIAQALTDLRADRTGENPLDFDGASDDGYEHLADLRSQLAEYAAEQGMSETAVGEDVLATVPGAGAGWRDSPQILQEYLRTKGVIADPPAGGGE